VKPLAGAVDDGFLQALGVTGSDGKPKAGKADKLRQIRKFVETLSALVRRGLSDEMSATEGVEEGEGVEDGEGGEDGEVGSGLGIEGQSGSGLGNEGQSGCGLGNEGQSRRSPLGSPADGFGQRLRIVDAGCGRGYLTFAAHRFFASKVSEND
jgi:hypothetical protein